MDGHAQLVGLRPAWRPSLVAGAVVFYCFLTFLLLLTGTARAFAPLESLSFSVDPLTSAGSDSAYGELIVGFHSGVSAAEESATVEAADGRIVDRLDSIDAAVVSAEGNSSLDEIAAELRSSTATRYVEPNYRAQLLQTPNDPSFNLLWGMHNTGQSGGVADADIDAPEAWDTSTNASLIVAVSDTGIDYNHPDLTGNAWTNSGEIPGNGIDDDGNGQVDDIHGYDFHNNDGDPMDDHSHGTHVSGTIGGVGNNSVGVVGVSWTTKLMGVKFLSAGGSGSYSNAVKSIDYAVANGAKVINASWGGGSYSQALYDSIESAGNSGVLFVAAAGNSAQNADQVPMYPAAFNLDNIVSVAASTASETLAYFSNYGATSVDLAAPGLSIYSSVLNDSYATYSGTSMASPHVAGASALYRASNPQKTPTEVRSALIATVDKKSAYNGKTVSGGRLNVDRLLRSDENPPPPDDPPEDPPPDDGCPTGSGGAGSESQGAEGQSGDGPTTVAEGSRQLIVKFKDDATAREERSAVDRAGADIEERIDSEGDTVVVGADPGTSRKAVELRLERSGAVEYAEPNYKLRRVRTPNDPYFSSLWGMNNTGAPYGRRDADIDAPEAWDHVTGTGEVVVAISDTGVDYNHTDLKSNMWKNPGETPGNGLDDDCNGYVDDVYGIDAYNDDADPIDDHGHGTHVAGTIGAEGNNGSGVVGVAWNTKLMAVKFLSRYGYGYTSDAVKTIDYAVDNGAKVINASWGGGGYSQALYDSLSRANDNGVVFVAAAGNNGTNSDYYKFYPAAYEVPNVVSVGASTIYEAMAYFSNYGKNSVELVAPGDGVTSTYIGNSYATMSGTSMAAPHVSGSAAMYLARNPDAAPSEVLTKLVETADQKPAYENKTVSGGRLNLPKLLGIEYDEPCSDSSRTGATSRAEASRQLIVGFADDASASEERAAVADAGSRIEERIDEIDAALVKVDPNESRKAVEEELERSGAVEYAEPNSKLEALREPNDPSFYRLWGLHNPSTGADIKALETWNRYTDSGDVVVAVIDTGIDYRHDELDNNMWSNPGETPDNCKDDDGNGFVDDVYGYNFESNNGDPMDDHSHGTHVSGTIGAEGDNGVGVVGVNWKTSLMGLKFLNSYGYGDLYDAVRAVNYATDNGAKVINASWGGGGFYYSLYSAINRAGNNGVVFVAAAGNSNSNTDYYPMYPAAYSLNNIVSVAASTSYDSLAYFSNYGKKSVDLAAPGQGIYSTVPDNSYATYSGTSMAAPHVTGAVAMFLARNPNMDPAAVRELLMNRSDKKSAFDNKTVSGGRLNLLHLLAPETVQPPERGKPPVARPPATVPGSPGKPPKEEKEEKEEKKQYSSGFRLLSPKPKAELSTDTNSSTRRVVFKWRKLKKAVRYHLYVNGKRRRVISAHGERKPKARAALRLRPGTYRWHVLAVDKRSRTRSAKLTGKRRATRSVFKVLTPKASKARVAKARAKRKREKARRTG